jgi:hypothetical protein
VNQALCLRQFIIGRGYWPGPVTVNQDNLCCISLVERGRYGAKRTRQIHIEHFWLNERVAGGEAIVKH